MNILITGGTGFIGQSLCPALLSKGHSLTVLSRYPNKVYSVFGDQIEQITSISLLSESDHFDAIYNFAGAPIFAQRWTDERKQVLLKSRIYITQQLVEFIARANTKPSVLLSGSAIGFYGDQGDTVLDETASAQDDFGHQLCAEWEHTAEKAKEHCVRVCLLRTGLVIGKNGGFLQPMILPFKLGLGGKLGSGTQWMPWIHMNDYVAICQALLDNNALEGVFNLTAPNPVTNSEFTRTLAKHLNRPAFFTIPGWALNLLLGEMSQLLLGSQRVIPKHILDSGFQFDYPNLEEALENVL
ncbi:MAG: TIGR01777 family protein [Burkholderiales bacterium]|nr:TIGR01777 family oxidoreductase [Nitrosomonas sp.]MCP5273458.1 TIGR01777 family protein [Burkholderiales bacterium]